jgi:hypothetical protein
MLLFRLPCPVLLSTAALEACLRIRISQTPYGKRACQLSIKTALCPSLPRSPTTPLAAVVKSLPSARLCWQWCRRWRRSTHCRSR